MKMSKYAVTVAALVTILIATAAQPAAASGNIPNFTAIIVFDGSTVDTGNNNYLSTTVFKADHHPYGVNFPTHSPTGRFADGKLIPDLVATTLGIKHLVPPYLHHNLSDDDVRTGVTFASAGSGFDDLTAVTTQSIPMWKQIQMFEDYMVRLGGVLGGGDVSVKKAVEGAMVVVSAGTNDFVYNYYDLKTRRLEFDLSGYQDFLLSRVQTFVQRMYDMGGRTIAVAGLPPIGCLPIQKTLALQLDDVHRRACVESQNVGSQSYNTKLKKMVAQLQSSLPHSLIAYLDVYTPIIDMVTNPQNYGMRETRKGCCGSGVVEVALACSPITPTCESPSEYILWDSVHPTTKASQHITHALYQHLISLYY